MYVLQTYVHLCYLWRILLSFKYCIKNYLFLSVNVAFWLKYNSCIWPFCDINVFVHYPCFLQFFLCFIWFLINISEMSCSANSISFFWEKKPEFIFHEHGLSILLYINLMQFLYLLFECNINSSQNPSPIITQLSFNRGWQLQALRLLRSRCHNNRNEWIWRLLYSRLWWPLGYSHSRRCYRMCF